MSIRLHYETVTPLLRKILNDVMANAIFDPFFLVGGTFLKPFFKKITLMITVLTSQTLLDLGVRTISVNPRRKA